MTHSPLELYIYATCCAYTQAKHPGVVMSCSWLTRRLLEEVGELVEALLNRRPSEVLADEFADVYHTLVLLAKLMDVSVERASHDKLQVLRSRITEQEAKP